MDDLVEILDIATELSANGIQWTGGNFEELYARLWVDGRQSELVALIENRVREYFIELRLPATPTLYDYLVLSLRPKDVIASFNWDPFLVDAWRRNAHVGPLPQTLFLHGNVGVGYCPHHRTAGAAFLRCPSCNKPFRPSKLMFPVSQKNYADDPYVAAEWEALSVALRAAYMLTIFGYSAPQSDVVAVRLMEEAWGPVPKRELEEIEIIDVKSPAELRQTWSPFIHTHHYSTHRSWHDSRVASYPRRTCEATWSQFMEGNVVRPTAIPPGLSLDELWAWVKPLIAPEIM